MKAKSLVLGTFAVCIGMGLLTACDNTNKKPETPTTPEKLVMTAPQVAANESGFIFLEDFPETDPHLAVKVSEDFTTATISYDGKEIQTVTSDDELASDDPIVRFLDANFDGLTDIYIGPGVPRTANSLLVWNENDQKYVLVDGTSLQNAMLEPQTKSFIEGGSNSAVEYYISRSLFKGDKKEIQEELCVIMAPEEYANNNVEHKYTLSDPDGKVLCSTETADQLPELWQKIVTVFDY